MRLNFDNVQNTLINTGKTKGARSRAFIVVLFAIKPFIDLTWNIHLFSIGSIRLNSLRIIGLLVFIIAGYLYFFQNYNKKIFNGSIIWIFIGLNLFTSIISVFFYNYPVMSVVDHLLKLFDAYFIYFIGYRYIENDRDKLRLIYIIWITMFVVSLLSTIQYYMGGYATDISQGVGRFSGFYNDAGTPSYNAVMSIIFGALYLELCKRQRQQFQVKYKFTYVLTLLVALFILSITVTKSAILMFVVFLMMWIGLYKRRSYIIIPLVIISGYCIYTTSGKVQKRMATEIEFFGADTFSMEGARSLGSGRVATWERVLTYYGQDFDSFQQFFGAARTFGAHNQYIAYLMQLGLVGLTVFLIMLLRFFRQLICQYRKYKQPDIYMAIVFLTVITVYGLTGHPFENTTFLWYLMILLSLTNVYTYKPSP